jgi:small conductance mechanosensitive channel
MEKINEYWKKTEAASMAFWPNLLSAILTLVIGIIIIKIFRMIMMRLISRKRFDDTLLKFVMDVLIWFFGKLCRRAAHYSF